MNKAIRKTKILMASAEFGSLARTGGLADAVANLSAAVQDYGCDVRVLLPLYHSARHCAETARHIADVDHPFNAPPASILEIEVEPSVTVWLLACDPLFDRPGTPYCDREHKEWPDNYLRFGLLSFVAARIATWDIDDLWQPDVVQLNDWHCGLAAAFIRARFHADIPVIFTVHNLGYPGNFDMDIANVLEIPQEVRSTEGIEFYGSLSFMKAGLHYADEIVTVSETYAEEIKTPFYGFGFDGVIRSRLPHITGILNGVNYRHWNPATDENINSRYDSDHLENKSANRAILMNAFGIDPERCSFLIGFLGRMADQKGIAWLVEAAPQLIDMGVCLIFMGEGEPYHEQSVAQLVECYPARIAAQIGYEEKRERQIIAGCDAIIMPSRYEPCGLTQLYAMRYGTVPIVRRTGGLIETVKDANEVCDGNGIIFDPIPDDENAEIRGIVSAVARAMNIHKNEQEWRSLQTNGMAVRRSWETAAEKYFELYQRLLPSR